MDNGGSADGEENIASSAGVKRARGFFFGHRFAEPDDVRPEEGAAARAAWGNFVRLGPGFHDHVFVETFGARNVAVQFNYVAAAGTAMEVIHVLRDESKGGGTLLPFDESDVGRVWFGFGDEFAPPRVPFPNQSRFAAEGGWGGELLRLEVRPKTGLRIAKRRDAAFSGDARAGENGDALGDAETVEEIGREGHWGVSLASLK